MKDPQIKELNLPWEYAWSGGDSNIGDVHALEDCTGTTVCYLTEAGYKHRHIILKLINGPHE